MTIHLPPDIESSIQAAAHSGRYASLDEAMIEAASLLVQRLNQEQAQAKPAAANQPIPPSYASRSGSGLWSGRPPFLMRNGINYRSMVLSSTTITSTARRNDKPRHEAIICRCSLLDRPRQPQRPMASQSRADDAFAGSSVARNHRRSARRIPDLLQWLWHRPADRRRPDG